jgi:hypothetical protein
LDATTRFSRLVAIPVRRFSYNKRHSRMLSTGAWQTGTLCNRGPRAWPHSLTQHKMRFLRFAALGADAKEAESQFVQLPQLHRVAHKYLMTSAPSEIAEDAAVGRKRCHKIPHSEFGHAIRLSSMQSCCRFAQGAKGLEWRTVVPPREVSKHSEILGAECPLILVSKVDQFPRLIEPIVRFVRQQHFRTHRNARGVAQGLSCPCLWHLIPLYATWDYRRN